MEYYYVSKIDIQMDKDNNICNYLDRGFLTDKNPHKYTLLWASVFYRQINYIMRRVNTEIILKRFPCTTYYIVKYIRYFYKYGVTKDRLPQISQLYRGLTNDFEIKKSFVENGFMSTSYDKTTAKKFAQDSGRIIIFPVELLPDDVPFVIINNTIADYLLEDEVLFLPGTIWTNRIKNNIVGKYKMNEPVINQYLSTKLPESKWVKLQQGGYYNGKTIDDLLSMGGKWLIFHRTIEGREPEILSNVEVPANKKKLIKFFKYDLKSIQDNYEHIMDLMTEVQDIMKILNDKNQQLTELKESELIRKMFSYTTYIAVYNPNTNTVETLYYDICPSLMKELSIDEIWTSKLIQMILNNCSFLDKTRVNTEWYKI